MEPTATLAKIPKDYGTPERTMAWADVRAMLEAERRYWIATLAADGRPHVVCVDGLWIDDRWYYGGSPQTVHMRNALRDPRLAMHIGDGSTGVIVDGDVQAGIARDEAERLADASFAKYPEYGRTDPAMYEGAHILVPRSVVAWTSYPADITRFDF